MSTGHNPYVGPRSFRRGEKLYGRDHEAFDLADLLISERIVLLYSPSGAGKSSLVEARLKPILEEEGFRILPTMRVGQFPGNGNGADRFQDASRYVLGTLAFLAEQLERPDDVERLAWESFSSYLSKVEEALEKERSTPYELLIFDQFEEIFTTGPCDVRAEKDRRTFFQEVGEALRLRHRWALFAMREDYIAALDPYVHSIPTRFANTFRLDLLKRPNAAEAIQKPAGEQGVEITDDAVQRLVEDLSLVRTQGPEGVTKHSGLHVEPVQLQVVCRRLWQRLESSGELTRTHRVDAAQVADAVADIDRTLGNYYAEEVSKAVVRSGVDERTVRTWFERCLITSGGIRKQEQEGPAPGEEGREALKALEDAFLIRSVSRHGATWYELAHDRLVQPVRDDNARWEKEHLSLLQRTSEDWSRKNRSEDLLLRGDALKEEERWAAENESYLSAIDREFLEACRKARLQSRRARRLKTLLAAVAAGVLLVVTFLYRKAETAYQEAEAAQRNAEAAQQKAEAAQRNAEEEARKVRGTRLTYLPHALLVEAQKALRRQDDSLSALLALQAYRFREDFRQPDLDPRYGDATIAADRLIDGKSVHEALTRVIFRPYFDHLLRGHGGSVRTVAFSPDGTLLASGGADGTVRLWRLKEHFQRVKSLEAPTEVRSVAFSPDGRWLAAGLSPDGAQELAVRLWPIRNGTAEPHRSEDLAGHEGNVRTVLFHPAVSPSMLVSSGNDGKLMAWRLGPEGWDKEPLWSLTAEHDGESGGIAFSPDGGWLASCGSDDRIYLWSLDAGLPKEPGGLLQAEAWTRGGDAKAQIRAVAFAPQGLTLAAAGPVGWENGKPEYGVTLFDLDEDPKGGVTTSLPHSSDVRSLAYAGKDLLTGSTSTGEVVVWSLSDGFQPTLLSGQRSWVSQVAGGPDGRFVASGGSDKKVHLWERLDPQAGGEPKTTEGVVRAIAISPKESLSDRWVAAGLENGKVELYSLESDGSLGELRYPLASSEAGGGVRALSFDSGGARLAAVGADRTVRVWDLTRPQEAPRWIQPGWMADWKLPGSALTESGGDILSWAPSSGRRWLAAAIGGKQKPWMHEGRVRVWDLEAVQEPGKSVYLRFEDSSGQEVSQSGKTFSSVAWSGDRLAAGNWDGKVRIWDFAKEGFKSLPRELVSGHSGVVSVAWGGDDGQFLASGHSLGTVLVWEATVEDSEPIVFQGHKKKVYAVAFGDDGHLFSGGEDGTLRTWKLPSVLADEVCEVVGRNLGCDEWDRFVGGGLPLQSTCPGPDLEECKDEAPVDVGS